MLLTSNSGVDSIVQLITVLVLFIFVLAVTLFVTKWMAGFQRMQNEGKNIQVIETVKLSPNQFAQILKIGDQYVAVALSKENVTVLALVDESQLNLDTSNQSSKADFASVLNSIKKTFPGKNDDTKSDDSVADKD